VCVCVCVCVCVRACVYACVSPRIWACSAMSATLCAGPITHKHIHKQTQIHRHTYVISNYSWFVCNTKVKYNMFSHQVHAACPTCKIYVSKNQLEHSHTTYYIKTKTRKHSTQKDRTGSQTAVCLCVCACVCVYTHACVCMHVRMPISVLWVGTVFF